MHFPSRLRITVVLTLTSGLVGATPTSAAPDSLIISHVIPVDAPTANALTSRALVPCSGSNDVACGSGHKATSTICNQLLTHLSSSDGTVIANSPRAVCLGQSGNQCCVSWSVAVGDIPQGDLFNAQNKVYRDCFGGTISGLAQNVNLNGGCVTECLSNRPDRCS
ncbi:hypothetical protein B0H14DRAFT_3455341 [Mycena olivaceomarginata]|nr:hypothetical protein B0H14DRAFT_3455341 [Mycena olivaceomarginata]